MAEKIPISVLDRIIVYMCSLMTNESGSTPAMKQSAFDSLRCILAYKTSRGAGHTVRDGTFLELSVNVIVSGRKRQQLLHDVGIHRVADLVLLEEVRLRCFRGFGSKTVERIKFELEQRGYGFKTWIASTI